MDTLSRTVSILAFAAAAAACGSRPQGYEGSAADSVGTFPAFAADIAATMPQLTLGSGPVLGSAHLVVITYPADGPSADTPDNLAAIQDFTNRLGGTAYWSEILSQYGVGPIGTVDQVSLSSSDLPQATKGNTQNPDGSFSVEEGVLDSSPNGGAGANASVVSFLNSHAADPNSGWPAIDDNTVFLVFVPASVHLVTRVSTNPGERNRMNACDSFQGYHFDTTRHGKANNFMYGLVFEGCTSSILQNDASMTLAGLPNTTDSASHEIAEAITDPDAQDGLNGFNEAAWSIFNEQQEEVGDACENYPEANAMLDGAFPYEVQGLWSNQMATAGHNPCVSNDATPYYNVVPLGTQTINVVVPPQTAKTTATIGYQVPSNATTASFQLGLFSDADTGGPWQVSAFVGGSASTIVANPTASSEQRLTVSFDGGAATTTGSNGSQVTVNLSVDRSAHAEHGSTRNGIVVTFVSSKPGLPSHYLPVMIGI